MLSHCPQPSFLLWGNHRPVQLSDCVFSCISYQQEKDSLYELELFTEDLQQPDICEFTNKGGILSVCHENNTQTSVLFVPAPINPYTLSLLQLIFLLQSSKLSSSPLTKYPKHLLRYPDMYLRCPLVIGEWPSTWLTTLLTGKISFDHGLQGLPWQACVQ